MRLRLLEYRSLRLVYAHAVRLALPGSHRQALKSEAMMANAFKGARFLFAFNWRRLHSSNVESWLIECKRPRFTPENGPQRGCAQVLRPSLNRWPERG